MESKVQHMIFQKKGKSTYPNVHVTDRMDIQSLPVRPGPNVNHRNRFREV